MKSALAPLLVVALLAASGTATGQQTPAAPPPAVAASDARPASAAAAAFDVDISAPKEVADYLQRHLELMQYRALTDLDATELERLMIAADANVRDLLGTLGYFSPEVQISQSTAAAEAGKPPLVSIVVQTGPQTLVTTVEVEFRGAIALDAQAAEQRAAIRSSWKLSPGKPFTQAAWDDAKAQALRLLSAQRYPVGRIASSRAEIDPDRHTARLSVTLDSGLAYQLGLLRIDGLARYDTSLVERLARLKPGQDYDQGALLEAQQRLQNSGHFDSVYVELDTKGAPEFAPVMVTLRESKRNKLLLGVGVSTDHGLRLSVEHTNHQLPLIGWRAVSKLALDRHTQSIGSELMAPPDDANWQRVVAGELKHEDAADATVRSALLRVGRTQSGERIDRNYYLQYDHAATTAIGVNETAQSITANYAWRQRRFDRRPYPSSGYGLGVELGGGWTLGSQNEPFLRALVHWLGVFTLASLDGDKTEAGASRIAVRAQTGAVLAKDGIQLPSTQLFLTGGDATVRGYAFESIGSKTANGIVVPGRYLAVGSVEWQRPILIDGRPSDWESTLFIDAGAVADAPAELKAKVGIGAGVRYRSPVGPLQIDLAYGVASKGLRLHLSVGFTF